MTHRRLYCVQCPRLRTAVLLAASSAALALFRPASAQVVSSSWSGGTTGSWFTAANWTPAAVPNNGTPAGAEYSVAIAQPSSVNAALDTGTATIDSLDLSAASGMLTLTNQLTVTNANSGGISVANGDTIQLSGTSGILDLGGNVFTQGGGGMVLAGGGIQATATGQTLTNAFTISGAGGIGAAGSSMALNNQAAGLIDANVSGQTLTVQTLASSASTNAGTLRASNGGTLSLIAFSKLTNTGTITALDGSTVSLDGGTIAGGTLSTTGTGVLRANNITLDGTASAVTLAGPFQVAGFTQMKGAVTNSGAVTFTTANSRLFVIAPTTLSGGGTVTLSPITSTGIQNGAAFPGTTLTNASTINGAGHLGDQGGLVVVNQGTGLIDANISGQTLVMGVARLTWTNAGTMRASGGGRLALAAVSGFSPADINNAGGTIAALDGSTVVMGFGGHILGGTLTTAGSGVVIANSVQFDGTTNPIVNTGAVQVGSSGGGSLGMSGTVTNNGTIVAQSGGSIFLNGATTLGGTGALTLTSAGSSAGLSTNANVDATLTNASTINGEGAMSGNSAGPTSLFLSNQSGGLIDANASGKTLNLQLAQFTAGSSSNAGTLRASNGGTLAVSTGLGTLSNTGAIVAQTGGTVSLLGVSLTNLSATTLTNGSYQASGTGSVLQLANNANVTTLSNASVTLDGAGAITDQSGNDAFRNLATVGSGSALNLLNGHAQSVAAGLANNGGTVSLSGTGATALTVTAAYGQTAGVTDIAGPAAVLTAPTAAISGGTLRGNGTFATALTVTGGTVSPGESPGTLTVTGSLALSNSAILLSELSGTTKGTTYDFLSVSGAASLGGTLQAALLSGFRPSGGNTFTILTAGSPLTGSFANAANGSRLTTTDGTGAFTVNFGPTSPFDPDSVVLSNFASVPEPASMLLFIGAAGWTSLRRRRPARKRMASTAPRPSRRGPAVLFEVEWPVH